MTITEHLDLRDHNNVVQKTYPRSHSCPGRVLKLTLNILIMETFTKYLMFEFLDISPHVTYLLGGPLGAPVNDHSELHLIIFLALSCVFQFLPSQLTQLHVAVNLQRK